MFIDDLVYVCWCRLVWYFFEYQGGGVVGQWVVQQIVMVGDLVYVGGVLINIVWMVVENVFKGGGCIDQIVVGGVQYFFWFIGGVGGIEDEQWIFGVYFDGLVFGVGVCNQVVLLQIVVFLLVDIVVGVFQDYYVFNVFYVWVFQCVIDVFFQWDGVIGVQFFVSGDYQV